MIPLLLVLALGCPSTPPGDDTAAYTDDGALVGVSVSPYDPTLAVGERLTFTARAYFGGERDEALASGVRWVAEDPRVLVIGDDGAAEALAAGTTSVIATYEGLSAKVRATVRAETPTGVAMSPSTLTLGVGARAQLQALASYPDGGSGQITASCSWTSSDIARVTVDDRGEVRGLRVGSATVQATCGALAPISATVDVTDDPAALPLPDLRVGAFTVEVDGRRATWTVAVENRGAGHAGAFWVDLFLDRPSAPTPADDMDEIGWVPGLGAGERRALTLELANLSPGVYASWVAVDLDGRVAETDEANNARGPVSVTIGDGTPRPDLIIARIDALADGTDTLYEIVVRNQGQAEARAFWVDLFEDSPTDPPLHALGDDFLWVERLGAGQSTTWDVLLPRSPGVGASWSSVAFVDITAAVDEADEANNLGRTTVTAD